MLAAKDSARDTGVSGDRAAHSGTAAPADGHTRHTLSPGMAVTAEIKLGTRSVIEYFLSPVRGAFHEAGRER